MAKNTTSGVCYLTTSTNQPHDIVELFNSMNGEELTFEEQTQAITVIEEKIVDVSFLPERVHEECNSGFQWMADDLAGI